MFIALILLRVLFWALVGSFATAYVHEKTGRDVRMGGLIGLFVGAIGGAIFLGIYWLWLHFDRDTMPRRDLFDLRRWYEWYQ